MTHKEACARLSLIQEDVARISEACGARASLSAAEGDSLGLRRWSGGVSAAASLLRLIGLVQARVDRDSARELAELGKVGSGGMDAEALHNAHLESALEKISKLHEELRPITNT